MPIDIVLPRLNSYKKIHNDLKITEPRITYDEIIWRLIENDKTINLFS